MPASRTFPEALDTSSTLSLDFSQTRLSDKDAFKELAALSDRWKLGLVKVLPELSGDQNRQVFVPLGSSRNLPDPVRWYGDQAEGRVAHSGSLEQSFATGTYLVTGDPTHLDEFQGR
ncbi:hypothetical protein [Allorhizocola rhizosphaerae]|uniref:hypothetical protein n=1 Tax=Allorhizocola rhizosphaerae TaxID=1872709 RepID=UPI000E3E0204|nr:hypothetical protein [Allorhizocola rhizosphaerae]